MFRFLKQFLSKSNNAASEAPKGKAAGKKHRANEQGAVPIAGAASGEGMFANISAELRTPLTLILAPLESMLMGEHGEVSERQKRILKLVHNNSVKLMQIISGVLDLSKLEAGTIEVRRQPLNALGLVASLVEDFQVLAQRKQIRLRLEHEHKPLTVNLDRYLFERVVFNLLSNAIKFSPELSEITVTLTAQNDRLLLTVRDTGPGIAPEEQETIFQQFHKIHGMSSPAKEGVGLGLALVKEFATLLGGSVRVESQLGQGSIFIVDMLAPLITAPSQHAKEADAPATAAGAKLLRQFETILPSDMPEPAGSGKKPRVLICEANSELGAYVADLLGQLCQTRVVADGDAALDVVYEWKPDLVMTGIALPKRDGLSVCREIKGRPETAMIPVILLTSLTQRDAMLKGWDAGADEYLFKPFHPAELVTRVRSLLRSVQQRRKAQEQIERLNEALERRVIELADANKELKMLATKLEQARDQALEASRFKSVFLANMSHEIRTPINGVISMSDMLMRTPLNSEQGEIANIIRDSANALLDIINDILDFSKIEAGKVELEIVDFELSNVIEGTAELVGEQARHKNLSLMTYVSPDIPQFLRGDPGRLRQILLNLLSNAIKFTSTGEVLVQVSLDAKDEDRCRVRFSVTDTGIGMAQEAVHRLFQPFTQADGSITRKYGGTGLGLSIAKLLVELLGGRIGVRSTEGKGSTFWFSVPLERARIEQQDVPSDAQNLIDMANTRVLVLEPYSGTASILMDYLSSWKMHSTHVTSGREALDLLRRSAASNEPYDVALVENHLDDMSALEFLAACKLVPALCRTRLVLCTSSDDSSLGEIALQRGFNACLMKPIKQSRLYDCLAMVMDRCDKLPASPTLLSERRLMTSQEMAAIQNTGMVLVAEDNPVNQKVAALLLKELGFAAHVVANGREAVEAVSRTPYSIILMDCQMPDMDGFEATGAIRRAETLTGKHIPIIAMTAHAMQGDREKCIAAGMDDYVSKPVTAAKLKEVLLRWFKACSPNWRGLEPMPVSTRGDKMNSSSPPSGGQDDAKQSDSGPNERAPSKSTQVEVLNMAALESACGEEGAQELLQIFIESTQDLFSRMDSALQARSAKQLKACAHEMKGACGSVGANTMATISKSMELGALAEDWDLSTKLLRELKENFAAVRTFCEGVLHRG